jgi:hypothetical protein
MNVSNQNQRNVLNVVWAYRLLQFVATVRGQAMTDSEASSE